MSDVVTAALIGIGGAVLVAVASAITQVFVTRGVIRAERQKLTEQLAGEELSRERTRRRDRLVDAISELLAAADPQIAPGGNYDLATRNIHRVQLLLNLEIRPERALNDAVNALGLRLQEYLGVRHLPIDSKLPETQHLLKAHSAVVDLAREVLNTWAT